MCLLCPEICPEICTKFAQNLQKMCISLPHFGGKNG